MHDQEQTDGVTAEADEPLEAGGYVGGVDNGNDRPSHKRYHGGEDAGLLDGDPADRKSTRLNSSHSQISYAVFCLKKKNILHNNTWPETNSENNTHSFNMSREASQPLT